MRSIPWAADSTSAARAVRVESPGEL